MESFSHGGFLSHVETHKLRALPARLDFGGGGLARVFVDVQNYDVEIVLRQAIGGSFSYTRRPTRDNGNSGHIRLLTLSTTATL
jgi:hypothetical protein